MRDLFEWAAGSIAGRDHRHSLKNSHDAWAVETSEKALVAVVCDGCGSGGHSEVGAKIGARLVVKQMLVGIDETPALFRSDAIFAGLARIQRKILEQIVVIAHAMDWNNPEIVSDYFLFTILGVIVTAEDTIIFGSADGVFWVNDSRVDLVAPDNLPPYLGYRLIASDLKPDLKPYYFLRPVETQSILLGTDGIGALAAAADKNIPGKDEKIGPINQFWEQDRYFKNPFAIQHRLNLMNRDFTAVDYEAKTVREEHGPMTDDTTIVVVRRRR